MRLSFVFAAASATVLSACATVEQFPTKRTMTPEAIDGAGAAPLIIVENVNGIEKSWFYSPTQGAAASYGLIGAFTAMAIDAVVNAAPSHRAAKVADKIAEYVPAEGLSDSLIGAFEAEKSAADAVVAAPPVTGDVVAPAAPARPGVQFAELRKAVRIGAKDMPADDTVDVAVQYLLSGDAAALRVTATAVYASATRSYRSPFAFEKSTPKSERSGPLYRNVFTYESDAFPLPLLTDGIKAELITTIENDYRSEAGALPVEGDDFKKMAKEIEDARDNSLSKTEASLFLARNWTENGAAKLRAEIGKAHAFFAKTILSDINDTVPPSFTGVDKIVEEAPDGRVVRMVGAGAEAGSYVSSPGRGGQSLVSYGNTSKIADINEERRDALKLKTADKKSGLKSK